jgi:hypothetical protein
MWAILKFDKKNLETLKKDLSKILGNDFKFYIPKLLLKKYKNEKIADKEFYLLDDYLFCFHKKISNKNIISALQYSRGLKYFIRGFYQTQPQINNFIKKCKEYENTDGYLSQEFFELNLTSKFKFISGPFANEIFKIIELQEKKIKILIGNLKTTINKKELLFKPI